MTDSYQSENEPELHYVKKNNIKLKDAFPAAYQSYLAFFNAPFKNIVMVTLLVVLNAVSMLFLQLSKKSDFEELSLALSAVVFLAITFFLYGFLSVKRKKNGEVRFADYFIGFKEQQFAQLVILVLPILLIAVATMLLVESGVVETVARASIDDIGWVLLMVFPFAVLYLIPMFAYFTSLSLLVKRSEEDKNIDLIALMINGFKGLIGNFWVTVICLVAFLSITAVVGLFPPLLIISFVAFMYLFDHLASLIFSFTDQPESVLEGSESEEASA